MKFGKKDELQTTTEIQYRHFSKKGLISDDLPASDSVPLTDYVHVNHPYPTAVFNQGASPLKFAARRWIESTGDLALQCFGFILFIEVSGWDS